MTQIQDDINIFASLVFSEVSFHKMKSFIWTCFFILSVIVFVMTLVLLLPTKWTLLPRRLNPAAEKVTRRCRELPKIGRQSKINWSYLYYYDDRHTKKNIVWCKVPKAGSTTLTKMFLRLAGARNVHNTTKIHRMLRAFYPRLTNGAMVKRMKNSFKFVVVRDPFERILSAYRDKLENAQRDMKYRDGYYYNNYGKYMVIPNVPNNTVQEPTWHEFVKYLIKTPIAKFDEHWMPIHRLCPPCSIRFDAVVKLENFNEEILLPLRRGGISAHDIGWAHKTGTYNNKIIRQYFQNISFDDTQKLYNVYKKDFTLFGYSALKYFRLANSSDVLK